MSPGPRLRPPWVRGGVAGGQRMGASRLVSMLGFRGEAWGRAGGRGSAWCSRVGPGQEEGVSSSAQSRAVRRRGWGRQCRPVRESREAKGSGSSWVRAGASLGAVGTKALGQERAGSTLRAAWCRLPEAFPGWFFSGSSSRLPWAPGFHFPLTARLTPAFLSVAGPLCRPRGVGWEPLRECCPFCAPAGLPALRLRPPLLAGCRREPVCQRPGWTRRRGCAAPAPGARGADPDPLFPQGPRCAAGR